MSNIETWRKISTELVKILKVNSVQTRELCLVGSQAKGHNPESDFDSVLIIRDYPTFQQLLEIRIILDDFLISNSYNHVYHYKLFNEIHFELFSTYDGYRLADFQKHNLSLLRTNYLSKHRPNLDKQNLINSILIQFVYRFMNSLPITSIDNYVSILTKWTKINLTYNPKIKLNSDDKTLQFFRDNDELFSNFFNSFIDKKTIDITMLLSFLQEYYQRIPHELINKSNSYSQLIKQRL